MPGLAVGRREHHPRPGAARHDREVVGDLGAQKRRTVADGRTHLGDLDVGGAFHQAILSTTVDPAKALKAAADALAAGNHRDALVQLLDAWRELRHPRIANVIDFVSEGLTAGAPPIKGKTAAARAEAWFAVERNHDPADLGRLVAAKWPGTWKPAVPYLLALVAWPDDPRLATAFAKLVDATQYDTWTSERFWQPLFRRLDQLDDIRQLPLMRDQLAKEKPFYYRRDMRPLEEASVAKLEQLVEPRLTAPVAAALAVVEGYFADRINSTQTALRNSADHLAAIHAAPDDLATRAVYADWLQEHGDPHGEFIALQLAGAPGTEPRQRKLIEKHGKAFAGTLGKYFERDSWRFANGFFAGGELSRFADDKLDEMLLDPAWRLVTTLAAVDDRQVIAFLDRPELPLLRAIEVDGGTAAAIASGPPRRITRLASGYVDPAGGRAIAEATALPELRELGTALRDDTADWLLGSAVLQRVERLAIGTHATLPAVIAMLAERGGALREVHVSRWLDDDGWTLVLARDAAPGPFTRATLRWRPLRRDRRHRYAGSVFFELTAAIPVAPLRTLAVIWEDMPAMSRAEHAQYVDAVSRFAHAQVTVPWQPPAPADDIVGAEYSLLVRGPAMLEPDRAAAVWTLAAELGQRYDSFEVGWRSTLRKLSTDPLAQIRRWAGNQRCSRLDLKRDGTRGELVLTRSSRPSDFEPTQAVLIGVQRSPAELVEWFARFTDLAELATGTFDALRSGPRSTSSFALPGYQLPAPGWLVWFGKEFADPVPVDVLRQLEARVAGTLVRPTKHGVVLAVSPTPDEAVADRLAVVVRGLDAVLAPAVAERLGYDFRDRARAVFPAIELASHSSGSVDIGVRRLDLVLREPLGTTVLAAELRNGEREWIDGFAMPAGDAAQLDAALARAAKVMG
jgi:uncharacterized protein (TIGR02996 family)